MLHTNCCIFLLLWLSAGAKAKSDSLGFGGFRDRKNFFGRRPRRWIFSNHRQKRNGKNNSSRKGATTIHQPVDDITDIHLLCPQLESGHDSFRVRIKVAHLCLIKPSLNGENENFSHFSAFSFLIKIIFTI